MSSTAKTPHRGIDLKHPSDKGVGNINGSKVLLGCGSESLKPCARLAHGQCGISSRRKKRSMQDQDAARSLRAGGPNEKAGTGTYAIAVALLRDRIIGCIELSMQEA